MAMNRKTAVGLGSLVGVLIGIGIGWLLFGMKKGDESLAGKECSTADGKKGKTDSFGVCKPV